MWCAILDVSKTGILGPERVHFISPFELVGRMPWGGGPARTAKGIWLFCAANRGALGKWCRKMVKGATAFPVKALKTGYS